MVRSFFIGSERLLSCFAIFSATARAGKSSTLQARIHARPQAERNKKKRTGEDTRRVPSEPISEASGGGIARAARVAHSDGGDAENICSIENLGDTENIAYIENIGEIENRGDIESAGHRNSARPEGGGNRDRGSNG